MRKTFERSTGTVLIIIVIKAVDFMGNIFIHIYIYTTAEIFFHVFYSCFSSWIIWIVSAILEP